MPPILKLALSLFAMVVITALLAAGGSGWRGGWAAFKGFGGYMAVMLVMGFVVWLGLARH